MIDPSHWDGLPDGHSRATNLEPCKLDSAAGAGPDPGDNPLAGLLARHRCAGVDVAHRPLADYAAVGDQPADQTTGQVNR